MGLFFKEKQNLGREGGRERKEGKEGVANATGKGSASFEGRNRKKAGSWGEAPEVRMEKQGGVDMTSIH